MFFLCNLLTELVNHRVYGQKKRVYGIKKILVGNVCIFIDPVCRLHRLSKHLFRNHQSRNKSIQGNLAVVVCSSSSSIVSIFLESVIFSVHEFSVSLVRVRAKYSFLNVVWKLFVVAVSCYAIAINLKIIFFPQKPSHQTSFSFSCAYMTTWFILLWTSSFSFVLACFVFILFILCFFSSHQTTKPN